MSFQYHIFRNLSATNNRSLALAKKNNKTNIDKEIYVGRLKKKKKKLFFSGAYFNSFYICKYFEKNKSFRSASSILRRTQYKFHVCNFVFPLRCKSVKSVNFQLSKNYYKRRGKALYIKNQFF